MALASGGDTLVQTTESDARVVHRVTVKGRWGLPLVAYDNTVEGLVQRGRTLLLAQNIYAGDGSLRTPTRFKLLDARTLKASRTITLSGSFSFDAASPDGRYVYLIEYFSSEEPTLHALNARGLEAVCINLPWKSGPQRIGTPSGSAAQFRHAFSTMPCAFAP